MNNIEKHYDDIGLETDVGGTTEPQSKPAMIIIVIIIAIIFVVVLGFSLYFRFLDTGKRTDTPPAPTQKTVNFLGETIPNGTSGATTIAPLKQEGYENSWRTANPENYRNVMRNADVKWYNTSSDAAIPSDIRGNSFLNEGFSASGGYRGTAGFDTGDDANPDYEKIEPVDEVGKAAIANAKNTYKDTQAAVAAEETPGDKLAPALRDKAQDYYPGGYRKGDLVAKGGLMESSTPIPFVTIEGKQIAVPGITGLDYYNHFESTALTGGSVARYARDRNDPGVREAPMTGSYNSKSYYGSNPYTDGTDQILPFGNTPVGYKATDTSVYNTNGDIDGNSGKGVVTQEDYDRVAESCKAQGYYDNSLKECITNSGNMAGQVPKYSKADLVTSYSGGYSTSSLYADGIPVMASLADQIAIGGIIAEEAEIEYKEEMKKNADIAMMENSDTCNPMLIYQKWIGFVDEEADSTTPQSYRVA